MSLMDITFLLSNILNAHKTIFILYSSHDSQSIVLRGHHNSVTDVLFGKKENILLSTSRDKTIRLWKADSYTCACVYRYFIQR